MRVSFRVISDLPDFLIILSPTDHLLGLVSEMATLAKCGKTFLILDFFDPLNSFGDDRVALFLVNPVHVIAYYETLTAIPTAFSTVFIDVAGENPIFLSELLKHELLSHFGDILDSIQYSKNKILRIATNPDWCMTSLFGLLLGYPFVYYLRSKDSTNCLSNIPLVLHELVVKLFPDVPEVVITSFTYPEVELAHSSINETLTCDKVENAAIATSRPNHNHDLTLAWFNVIYNRLQGHILKENLRLKTSVITSPCITL